MNTAVARENWEGQVVDGKFPLLKWLGGSERSTVFGTRLPGKPGQAAAIKLISPEAGSAERQIAQWQEAATLTHPHLLRLLHAGQCQISNTPLLYVVMELAEEDLSQVLPTRPLSPEEARAMLQPLLDVLTYLHQKRLVHGCIKPSNILAVGSELKLSSDSIRALTESREDLPRSAFDAPEVARGLISRAADMWSVGVMLVRCLSQRAQVRENYNPIEQGIQQAIPEPFRHIALECLRTNPNIRCTPADIRKWLQPEVAPPVVVPAAQKPSLRSFSVAAPIAAMVLLLAVFGWWWFAHRKQENSAPTEPQPAATAVARSQPSAPAPAAPVPVSTREAAPPAHSAPGAVADQVLPDVPQSARDTITGKVRVSVQVAVNPAGEVTDATLAAPGPSQYFARLAVEASRHWKFKPAEVDGQPVGSQWMLRFAFGRSSTEAFPTELPAGTSPPAHH